MGKKQRNQFWGYLRLGFVALAYVLYPYFVNQMPALATLLESVPNWAVTGGAIVFGAIVLVGPELLQESDTDPDELLQKLAKESREIIKDRLKGSLDQYSYIPIGSIDSPQDLERPEAVDPSAQTNPEPPSAKTAPGKKWRWSLKNFKPTTILPKALSTAVAPNWLLAPERELQNVETEEVTELEPSKPILEVFESAQRRLLILGEPGSGKTTELLKLADALAEAAKKDPEQPIPIIFELSAWRGEPMQDWMADRMAWQYGVNFQLCLDWLKKDRIVPLLDGLDELGDDPDGTGRQQLPPKSPKAGGLQTFPPQQLKLDSIGSPQDWGVRGARGAKSILMRKSCGKYRIKLAIEQIDSLQEPYHKQQWALVICCRIKDYEAVTDDEQNRVRVKKIDRAVRLCPLTDEQIHDYLEQRQGRHLWSAVVMTMQGGWS
jgi:hypothetical protein